MKKQERSKKQRETDKKNNKRDTNDGCIKQ